MPFVAPECCQLLGHLLCPLSSAHKEWLSTDWEGLAKQNHINPLKLTRIYHMLTKGTTMVQPRTLNL